MSQRLFLPRIENLLHPLRRPDVALHVREAVLLRERRQRLCRDAALFKPLYRQDHRVRASRHLRNVALDIFLAVIKIVETNLSYENNHLCATKVE